MQTLSVSTSQRTVLFVALSALALVSYGAFLAAGPKHAMATLIGGLAGLALYHASFGFTAAWRHLVTERRGTGLRAQFVLILLVASIPVAMPAVFSITMALGALALQPALGSKRLTQADPAGSVTEASGDRVDWLFVGTAARAASVTVQWA